MGILKGVLDFWDRFENLSLKISLILIGMQVIHLYWLATDVILPKAFGLAPMFPDYLIPALVIIDYVEIPGILAGIVFYLVAIGRHREKALKNSLLLIMLAVQIVHIFWITDEVVYSTFFEGSLVEFPPHVAWVAILIDYLEVPIIVDLFYKFWKERKSKPKKASKKIKSKKKRR